MLKYNIHIWNVSRIFYILYIFFMCINIYEIWIFSLCSLLIGLLKRQMVASRFRQVCVKCIRFSSLDAFHLTSATSRASFHSCLTFDYNEDEMMLASVADVKWNAPTANFETQPGKTSVVQYGGNLSGLSLNVIDDTMKAKGEVSNFIPKVIFPCPKHRLLLEFTQKTLNGALRRDTQRDLTYNWPCQRIIQSIYDKFEWNDHLFFLFQLKEFEVIGRKLPTEKEKTTPLYKMRIFAPDAIVAKSRFWYFLRQLKKFKKSTGEIVSLKQVLIRRNIVNCAFVLLVVFFGCSILVFLVFKIIDIGVGKIKKKHKRYRIQL